MAARKNALEDVSAASLALHAENFASATEKNVVPKFTNRLSWTLNKTCKYRGLLWAKSPRIWAESKTYTRKYVSEKTLILAYFTQCHAFQLLALKFTHHWIRQHNIILKVTNCKNFFRWTIVVILLRHFSLSWRFLAKNPRILTIVPSVFYQ